MTEVIGTGEFEEWYLALEERDAEAVAVAIGLLEEKGVTLGYPHSSDLKGTNLGELRELRVQSRGRAIRVAYCFDPGRQAVLLVGGDKTGGDRFYRWFISRAEKLWRAYLGDIRRQGHEDKTLARDPRSQVQRGRPRKDR
ncbi:MAG: type II toxin-antitoxin system RelE/ParE family toxin [Candidatus Binataceae bacterium]